MIHLVTFKKLKAEETGGWMSNLLSVGRGEPEELVELRQEALQVEGRLVLLDSILFSHWCRSLFSPQEARIHHHCFESNVVKHFGLDALHPLSHERQGRTSKLQELHHFVFFACVTRCRCTCTVSPWPRKNWMHEVVQEPDKLASAIPASSIKWA